MLAITVSNGWATLDNGDRTWTVAVNRIGYFWGAGGDLEIGPFSTPYTQLRIAGTIPASLAAAKTALTTLFPDANSSSGGSGVFATDVEVTDSTKGLILRAADGSRYRLGVIEYTDTDGNPAYTTQLTAL